MDNEKQDQERDKYNRLILANENAVDDLKQEQRKMDISLQELQMDLQRGYRTLALLNEDDLQAVNTETIRMHQRNEAQEQFFKRQLQGAEEQLNACYTAHRKVLEDETEELYRKRGELAWD